MIDVESLERAGVCSGRRPRRQKVTVMIKGKPPRLNQIYIDQPLYFVTLYRRSLLANANIHETFRTYCLRAADYNIGVGQYVLMPNHLHLFVRGGIEFDLGVWIRGLKRVVSRERDFWQPGFFDHILRSDESYSEKWNYVRENPVRAGLVAAADEWPFQGEIVVIDRA
jgi:REP element-mobilizing transposase RayT